MSVKAVIVGRALATLEPRLYQFFSNFAHDNALQVGYVENALAVPETLVEPRAAMRGEPQKPRRNPSHRASCGPPRELQSTRVAVHNRQPRKRSGRPVGRPDRRCIRVLR